MVRFYNGMGDDIKIIICRCRYRIDDNCRRECCNFNKDCKFEKCKLCKIVHDENDYGYDLK